MYLPLFRNISLFQQCLNGFHLHKSKPWFLWFILLHTACMLFIHRIPAPSPTSHTGTDGEILSNSRINLWWTVEILNTFSGQNQKCIFKFCLVLVMFSLSSEFCCFCLLTAACQGQAQVVFLLCVTHLFVLHCGWLEIYWESSQASQKPNKNSLALCRQSCPRWSTSCDVPYQSDFPSAPHFLSFSNCW